MLYLELAIVILSILILSKINTLSRKDTLASLLCGITMMELFIVVSNHAVIKSAYSWMTFFTYLIYVDLMNPLLLLISTLVINRQSSTGRKAGVALLAALLLTGGLYLLAPVQLLRTEQVQPLVALVLWLFAQAVLVLLMQYFRHPSKRWFV